MSIIRLDCLLDIEWWLQVAGLLGATRTDVQCLHRWNKVLKPGLHKGTWTKEEDQVVLDMVTQYGVGKVKWSSIAAKVHYAMPFCETY